MIYETEPPHIRAFLRTTNMQQAQQQIHQILTQNQGNRLTFELINGLTARLQMILAEHSQRMSQDQNKKSEGTDE